MRAGRAVRGRRRPARVLSAVHRHRYHGVIAPNARLRARVIALGRDVDIETADGRGRPTPSRHLDLPHTPPRLAPARSPPQPALEFDANPVAPADSLHDDDFDQTPAFDPTEPEPVPDLELDQTRGA